MSNIKEYQPKVIEYQNYIYCSLTDDDGVTLRTKLPVRVTATSVIFEDAADSTFNYFNDKVMEIVMKDLDDNLPLVFEDGDYGYELAVYERIKNLDLSQLKFKSQEEFFEVQKLQLILSSEVLAYKVDNEIAEIKNEVNERAAEIIKQLQVA